MLTYYSKQLAGDLTEEFSRQGTAVVFNQAGTFQDLLGRTMPGLIEENGVAVSLDEDQLKDYQRQSGHGQQLETMAEIYAKPLLQRLDVLRNQVLPFIDRVAAGIRAQYNEGFYKVSDIQEIEFADIYKTKTFLDYIQRHAPLANSQIQNVTIQSGFMDRNEDDIVGLLKSGNTSLDDALVDMIARHPSNWLTDVYTRYLVNGNIVPTGLRAAHQSELVDEIVVLYFIHASLLANDVIDGTVNIPLVQYRNYLSETFAQLGGLLNRYVNQINLVDQGGQVVAFKDENTNVIYVYKTNYEKYLEQGGNADAVLGAVALGSVGNINDLLENTERYANEFNRAYNEQINAVKAAFRSNYIRLFPQVFIEELKKEPSDFIALFVQPGTVIPETGFSYSDLSGRILTSLAPTQGYDNIYDFTKALILDIGLSHYSLGAFYRKVEQQMKATGEEDPQVATFAVVVDELVKEILANATVRTKLGL